MRDRRRLTLGEVVAAGKHPAQWSMSFPGGYKAYFKVVGPRHPGLKLQGGSADGMSYHFGSTSHKDECGEELKEKEARVYFDRTMTFDRFLHVVFHETNHTVVEWTGMWHGELLVAKEQIEDAWDEEDEDDE